MISPLFSLFILFTSVNPYTYGKDNNSIKYSEAARLADVKLATMAPWARENNTKHSVFYFYKRQLLLSLESKAGDRISLIESYDAQAGVVMGIIWSSVDTLNFRVENGAIRYNVRYPISKLEKELISNWENLTCLSLNNNNLIHRELLIVQQYQIHRRFKIFVK